MRQTQRHGSEPARVADERRSGQLGWSIRKGQQARRRVRGASSDGGDARLGARHETGTSDVDATRALHDDADAAVIHAVALAGRLLLPGRLMPVLRVLMMRRLIGSCGDRSRPAHLAGMRKRRLAPGDQEPQAGKQRERTGAEEPKHLRQM